MKCRFCANKLTYEFVDLVNAPLANSYLKLEQLNEPETYYPLKIYVCEKCWLVQVDEYRKSHEIFAKDYAYFSSFSKTWLEHSQKYAQMIANTLSLNQKSKVIEIASNDGYLLQFFKEKNIPCFGIEPSVNTALAAKKKGIETRIEFFTSTVALELAKKEEKADLLIGNNVLAHVPDIKDFIVSLKLALKETGTITMEFQHLLNILRWNQFDTIYHEHFSYLSLLCVERMFKQYGLIIYDVEEIPTHGGSIRIYARHEEYPWIKSSARVAAVIQKEKDYGLQALPIYKSFQEQIAKVKHDFTTFLLNQKNMEKKIAAYGAAAKGNTLLNYCGIKKDLIDFVVDASPYKQNCFLPGSHIPVVAEEMIRAQQPSHIIILPWNIRDEISQQLSYIREWGAKFVVAIPNLEIF